MGLKTRLLASGKTEDNEFNISLLGFKVAVNEGLTVFNLVDGIVDEFHDESGTDESEGSNDTYCATSDNYSNFSPICVSAAFTTTSITEPDTSTAGTNPGPYSGTYGSFTVPTGATSLNVFAWGAGGGRGNRPVGSTNGGGGGGGYVEGTLAVTSGQVLRVVVGEGGKGGDIPNSNTSASGLGGAGGAGPWPQATLEGSSYGGGLAGVFPGPGVAATSNLAPYCAPVAMIIAGGGGGGGYSERTAAYPSGTCVASGGAGGGLTGCRGSTKAEGTANYGGSGGGGDQEQGGQGGSGSSGTGQSGSFLQGGNGYSPDDNVGTGGGGYYGGGGAGVGGAPFCGSLDNRNGGGGSSYYGHPQVTSGSTEEGVYDEGGGVSQPNYVACTNEGSTNPGTGQDGEDGYVLLTASGNGPSTSTTIVSTAFSANSVPTTSRIVVFEENVDTPTLNTDIIASISRDGGSTYTNATLTDSGYVTGSSGQRILTGQAAISGQPSGQSMRWKLALANNRVKIHGVSLQWS